MSPASDHARAGALHDWAHLCVAVSFLCPVVKNTHSRSWAHRREQGTALPWHPLSHKPWCGMSLPQDSRHQGHTWSREEVGLLWLLFPLAKALLVCLSSLLFAYKNRTRSHRARLGRAALHQPWAHKSAMGTEIGHGDAVSGLSWHHMGASACCSLLLP